VPDSDDSDREKAYEKSNLKVQHVLADIEKFDRDSIRIREDQAVEFVVEEWSLDTEPGGVSFEDTPDSDELREQLGVSNEVSAMELFVLQGVTKNPGVAPRSVQSTVASLGGHLLRIQRIGVRNEPLFKVLSSHCETRI